VGLRSADWRDPFVALEEAEQQVRELKMSLAKSHDAERQQRERADLLAQSLRALVVSPKRGEK
jgi:hypothetical protein